MATILLLSLEFAPVQTTGAFRPIATAKYLSDFDVKPIVMTIDADSAADIWLATKNDALFQGLPDDMHVVRLKPKSRVRRGGPKTQAFQRLMRFSDGHYSSLQAALASAINADPDLGSVDAVLCTFPPFGAVRLAVDAAKLLSVPLVLDARDAWTQSDSGMPYPSYAHLLAQRREENYAFANCDAFITVTDRLRNLYARSHPRFPRDRQFVIPNGFDGQIFDRGNVSIPAEIDELNICYVGNFYGFSTKRTLTETIMRPHLWIAHSIIGEDWSYRGPRYFFTAWRELIQRDPDVGKRIRFHHVGDVPHSLMAQAMEHGVDQYCTMWGRVPKQKVSEILNSMQVMLATSMKRSDGGDYCLASKTFDYITARKPILGFVTEGSQKDFLIASGVSVICDPDNPVDSAETLGRLVTDGVSLTLNTDYVNKFHRREAARQMAEVIHRVIDNNHQGMTGHEVSPAHAP